MILGMRALTMFSGGANRVSLVVLTIASSGLFVNLCVPIFGYNLFKDFTITLDQSGMKSIIYWALSSFKRMDSVHSPRASGFRIHNTPYMTLAFIPLFLRFRTFGSVHQI